MKLYLAGEKGRAICETDGRVSTTFAYRDVPFSDGKGDAKNILVGVCDKCDKVVSIPPQSVPAIKAARRNADVSIEAMLPAQYLEILGLACYRIDPKASPEFRKRLLMYYVYYSANDKLAVQRLVRAVKQVKDPKPLPEAAKRRLSMKISPDMSHTFNSLVEKTRLSQTDLLKSLTVQIRKDIVDPERPVRLKELKALAVVANC